MSPLVPLPLCSESATLVVFRPPPLFQHFPPPPTSTMRFSALLFPLVALAVTLAGAGALAAADGTVATAPLASSDNLDPALFATSEQGESA